MTTPPSLHFVKMHGAGNDFVVLETTGPDKLPEPALIQRLCDRRKGVGADGLIVLGPAPAKEPAGGEDAVRRTMYFFNCDGSRAGMCGNGLRCAAQYVYRHGDAAGTAEGTAAESAARRRFEFVTDSGVQRAEVLPDARVRIAIGINESFRPVKLPEGLLLYKGVAGVPHAVLPVPSFDGLDIATCGAFIRHHAVFAPEGVNVDFVLVPPLTPEHGIPIRTFERGVEAETPACGTGIVSTARVLADHFGAPKELVFLAASGDRLETLVAAESEPVLLTGPAVEVFAGEWRQH